VANVTGWWAEVSTAASVPRMAATALLTPPTVSSVSPLNPSPPRMAAIGAMRVPAISLSTAVAVPQMAATAAMAVPALSNFVNAVLTPPRMSATAAMPVPAVSVSGDIAAPRMAATGALATPAVNTSSGVTYSDTFNRSNASTLGAAWNTDGIFGTGLTINSNAAKPDAGTVGGNIYATAMATGNNEITLVMTGTPTAGDIVLVVARSDNATNSSTATKSVQLSMFQGNSWTLYRYSGDSGVDTVGTESWAAGDTIVFSCVGATLTVKRNGSTVLTTGGATDLTAGYIGLGIVSSTVGIDSFTAQDI
jgi:hypothetical protein